MRILVINSGSSSIKFSIYDSAPIGSGGDPDCLCDGELSGIGTASADLHLKDATGAPIAGIRSEVGKATTQDAFELILKALQTANMHNIDAVGYRVVHPGPKLDRHVKITPEILADLEAAAPFAPLHDPAVLAVIRQGMTTFPNIPHFACFDTVFHQTMPEEATIYPIPKSFRDAGVHRYGFHGLSCESIVRQLAASPTGIPQRLVIAHLGSGCSITALRNGQSVDTTMGLTPTGGIVMGTRPGDLDPGLVLYLLRQQPGDRDQAAAALESLLNHNSGLVALSEMPNDVRALRKAAIDGNTQATLALKVFTLSITKALGAFFWLLGGLDAIVFTGGIGEHDAQTRSDVLGHLNDQGISINSQQNQTPGSGLQTISAPQSKIAILVAPAQEDLMIAIHVLHMAHPGNQSGT